VLFLSTDAQHTLVPICRHKHDSWVSRDYFDRTAILIIPVQISITISDDNIPIWHDFQSSRFFIKVKSIDIPSESDFILENFIILADWKESIADRVEHTSTDRRVIVKVDILYHLLGMRVPKLYSVVFI